MFSIKKNPALYVILGIALGIRLLALSHAHDFIWDELFSFVYSQKPWSTTLHFWIVETNPPLHMLFLKIWWLVAPATEFSARLPSVLFGTAAAGVVYAAAKKIDPRVATPAALLVALHPYFVFQSTLARGYSLLVFLAALSLNTFFTLTQSETPKTKTYMYLGLLNTLLLFDHLTGVFLILAESIYIITLNRKKLVSWLYTCLPLALPGVWILLSLVAKRASEASFGSAWFLNLNALPWGRRWSSFDFLFFGPNPTWLSFGITIALTSLIGFTLYRATKERTLPPPLIVTFLFAFIPTGSAAVLGLWHYKFFAIMLPAFALLISWSLSRCISHRMLLITTIFVLTIPGLLRTLPLIGRLSDWSAYNTFLDKAFDSRKKQIFITNSFLDELLMERYYHSRMPRFAYQTPAIASDIEKAYVALNYRLYAHPETELTAWYDEHRIASYTDVYLLYNDYIGVELPKVLTKNGWTLLETSSYTPGRDENTVLFHYAKH